MKVGLELRFILIKRRAVGAMYITCTSKTVYISANILRDFSKVSSSSNICNPVHYIALLLISSVTVTESYISQAPFIQEGRVTTLIQWHMNGNCVCHRRVREQRNKVDLSTVSKK